jgi:hypothetical protein
MAEAGARWLILAHQLPAHPSNLRVRVWRRLQQVGAVVLRNSLYVLPATDEAREDFNWVREEIQSSGGQVTVLEAAVVDGATDAELIQQFRNQRTADYEVLAEEIRKHLGDKQAGDKQPGELRKGKRALSGATRERLLHSLRERYVSIQARDYFGAAGRPLVEQAFREFELADGQPPAASRTKRLKTAEFRRRTWITRPRPGVDRIACAWLIRRFIDGQARFAFRASADVAKPKEVAFDMPDVEFGHHGPHCSFETFVDRFGLNDPAVVAISRVVHDLDLKESRFGMPECVAVGRLVDGLRASYADDARLLEQGIAFMEALYQSFASDGKPGRRTK